MGAMSITHWLIVIVVIALLFGGKDKISHLMADLGKGIKEFKNGVKEIDNG
jgi:sec-independent protein translocase protein TatA